MTERRSPEELFKAVLAYEHDNPDERPVESLSEAERDDELRSRGVDPDAVRARGEAHAKDLLAKLEASAAPPTPAEGEPRVAEARDASILTFDPRDSSRRQVTTVWLWAAAGLAVAAAVAFAILRGDIVTPGPRAVMDDGATTHHEDPVPSKLAAETLRNTAREQCAKQAWTECLHTLDEAKGSDPPGDEDPAIQQLRAAAQTGLSEPPPRAPAPDKNPKGPDKAPPSGGH